MEHFRIQSSQRAKSPALIYWWRIGQMVEKKFRGKKSDHTRDALYKESMYQAIKENNSSKWRIKLNIIA